MKYSRILSTLNLTIRVRDAYTLNQGHGGGSGNEEWIIPMCVVLFNTDYIVPIPKGGQSQVGNDNGHVSAKHHPD